MRDVVLSILSSFVIIMPWQCKMIALIVYMYEGHLESS